MSKIEIDRDGFLNHLREQLFFLKNSINNFQSMEAEAKRAANAISMLLIDKTNGNNKSLIFTHLGQTNVKFLETRGPKGSMFGYKFDPNGASDKLTTINNPDALRGLISPYLGLVAKEVKSSDNKIFLKYVPLFKYNNELSNSVSRPWIKLFPWGFGFPTENVIRGLIPFEDWWQSVIFETDCGFKLTRESLIKNMRDKDGGAHIDSNIKEEYDRLRKEDVITINIENESRGFDNIPVNAMVIQIAHETLVSIKVHFDQMNIKVL